MIVFWLLCLVVLSACSNGAEQAKEPATPVVVNYYAQDVATQVRLTTYDPTGVKTGETFATYVDGDIVVAPFSLIRGSHSVKATAMTNRTTYNIYGYTAFDFTHDIVLLRIGKRNDTERSLLDTTTVLALDTLFTIEGTYEGKMYRQTIKEVTSLPEKSMAGEGIFDNRGRLRGVVGARKELIPSSAIAQLMRRQMSGHSSVYDLRLQTGRDYLSYKEIAGFKIETTMGDIVMKLYDDVPLYRDNFIRLVSDGYYDSLLVHRVIPNFLIQTGAQDSKYAKRDDIVGWQGPGYTLPMVENQKHIHKRGAIAASKLPQDRNSRNRCDGGQFYIVSGRVYPTDELDKIAKEYRKSFTAHQRQIYTTVGGAPHLDDDYVVFGEVSKGMEVVDKIASIPVSGAEKDRPVEDVRVMKISIIKR